MLPISSFQAETTIAYPLVIASKHNIPFLLDKAGTGQVISGEVYNVNEVMLKILDDFEGQLNEVFHFV